MNAICRSSLYKIICRNRLDAGCISVTLAQYQNVSGAFDLSCYWYSCFVLLNQKSLRLFSLARILKLKIAARQHSTEICNARRFWSVLVVYCVDIMRLNHFTMEICVFYCAACHCFHCYTDVFSLCVFYHILECDILWMYLFLPYCVRKWHYKTVQSIVFQNIKLMGSFLAWKELDGFILLHDIRKPVSPLNSNSCWNVKYWYLEIVLWTKVTIRFECFLTKVNIHTPLMRLLQGSVANCRYYNPYAAVQYLIIVKIFVCVSSSSSSSRDYESLAISRILMVKHCYLLYVLLCS